MFNHEDIATAQLAQIFGSELLKVQTSARTDGGQTPDIVKINPKQFLVGEQRFSESKKAQELKIMEQLQREAEAAYPLQEQPVPPQKSTSPTPAPAPVAQTKPSSVVVKQPEAPAMSMSSTILERIAVSLERIANSIDKVEIKTKHKILKKKKPKTNNQILLNETNAP